MVSEKNHVESIVHNYPLAESSGIEEKPIPPEEHLFRRSSGSPTGLGGEVSSDLSGASGCKCHGRSAMDGPSSSRPQNRSPNKTVELDISWYIWNMTFQRLDTCNSRGCRAAFSEIWTSPPKGDLFWPTWRPRTDDVIGWSHLRIEWHLCQIFTSDIQQFHNGLWFTIEYPSAI